MENKKSKLGLIVLCALLVGLIAAGTVVYPKLTAQVEQEQAAASATPVPTDTGAQEEAEIEEAATEETKEAETGASETEVPAVTLQPAAQPQQEQAEEKTGETAEKPAEVFGPVMKNMAKDFTAYDDAGNPVTLRDMRGKPTVVNFFASWCGPCKMEMPYFETCYLEYGEQVNFMMVNLCAFGNDTKENGKKLVEEGGWTFPVYFDSDGDAAMGYAVRSMPTTIFVSADGELKGRHTGMIPEDTLRRTIEAMLAQ